MDEAQSVQSDDTAHTIEMLTFKSCFLVFQLSCSSFLTFCSQGADQTLAEDRPHRENENLRVYEPSLDTSEPLQNIYLGNTGLLYDVDLHPL